MLLSQFSLPPLVPRTGILREGSHAPKADSALAHRVGLQARGAQSWFKLGTSVRCEAVSPQIFSRGAVRDTTANLGLEIFVCC